MLINFTELVLDNTISFLNLRDIYFLKQVCHNLYHFKILNWHEYPYRTPLDSLDYLYNLDKHKLWEDNKLIKCLDLDSQTVSNNVTNGIVDIFRDKYEALIIKKVYNPTSFYFRGQIPDLEYFSLFRITILEISYTNNTYLPIEISNLTNLQSLIVNNNKFYEIPYPIFHLVNLINLDLHSNPIKIIDKQLLGLIKLKCLDISNTNIQSIRHIPYNSIESIIINGLSIRFIDSKFKKTDILKVI